MRSLNAYLEEYSESHRNPTNGKIHNWCVPLILWSLLGFLQTFSIGETGFQFSHALAFFMIVYYGFLQNVRLVLLMAAVMIAMFATFPWIPELRWVAIGVFVVAWIGQFYGHHIEGRKPSFFKDIFFLLIGPPWVAKKLFPKAF